MYELQRAGKFWTTAVKNCSGHTMLDVILFDRFKEKSVSLKIGLVTSGITRGLVIFLRLYK